ncbi:MAG: hypothetical protein ACK4PH_26210, partial [Aquincola tertiaricarbonis]
GLTTAASIWITASIGVLTGIGLYFLAAAATAVTLGVLSLYVSDNGRGLSSEDLAKARSFGIRGLHERAGTVGGWVELSSGGSGRGTTLILSVPLHVQRSAPGDDEDFNDATAETHDPSAWGKP